MKRRTFPRAVRLLRRSDFRAVYEEGSRYSNSLLQLFVRRRPEGGQTRVGLTVTRREGCAVVRNRLKRRVRECFRLSREKFAADYDLVVNIRSAAGRVKFKELERRFVDLVQQAGVKTDACERS
ncbi:MAG: ribonuclease P protein component [bacterium]